MTTTVKLTSDQLSHTYAVLLPLGGSADEVVKKLAGYVDKNGNSYIFVDYEDLRNKTAIEYEGLESDTKIQDQVFPAIIKLLQALYAPKTNIVIVLHDYRFLNYIKLPSKRTGVYMPNSSVVKKYFESKLKSFAVEFVKVEVKKILHEGLTKEDLIDGGAMMLSDIVMTFADIAKNYSNAIVRYNDVDELCASIVKILGLKLAPVTTPTTGTTNTGTTPTT